MSKTVLLTAGGTGGHLFPAQALASELIRRGWTVELATDERADKYGSAFPARDVHIISSETIRSKNPVSLAKTALRLFLGTLQARAVIKKLKPDVVAGFGGYPTFPPMFAARLTNTPSILHEANGVMGRANKLLAKGATAIATSVPIDDLPAGLTAKLTQTGNPVRDAVLDAAELAYSPPQEGGPLNLLVFGGSQGARFFSDLLPPAVTSLPEAVRDRLKIVQQCRPEDMERVQAAYDEQGVDAECAPFFQDLPQRIAQAHLVICRSGASSVSELAVLGRPSILVPLPGALDQDQAANAKVLEKVGGAWPIREVDLYPDRLAQELQRFANAPGMLAEAAQNARSVAKPDAVKRLADLVEAVAETKGERP
ncbi:undecaprenyldiphospho-muramoylpentapeptide beta-N-acetylglucosaminyltransferase [Roseibium denhamense]|uniref:UDP-N-acetylglucosamine--N-acetylmuramyl-(pentapeptide) pyrophosphoryl-undecaprenol N-acetylglucosamine transferase n=1 Tax=Roseibium denhamense TaxID=76305 RepID=A0ABY1NAX5_9HYPH|nr:undecaprenyldiphospho-muramoylpentapeptide beta-N-acetylglucosaminyltransferase [Roseibium denhamense]MTI06562.1 undecaprenyldiphospho-muramoylpentapeptide beta-N-acetylglucosaminyltransferase [Roseibium denhamense]SMP05111.1 UDP-N-acetylglucosamine-N-acetylmuramylpentapeptide N-acetylglucosamine transferase [Roseibium denhamense]